MLGDVAALLRQLAHDLVSPRCLGRARPAQHAAARAAAHGAHGGEQLRLRAAAQ